MRRERFFFLLRAGLLAAALGTVTTAATAQEFKKLADDQAYADFVAKLEADRIDPVKVGADPRPDYGTLIQSVDPGTPAEKAGIQPGWILRSIDGQLRWDHGVDIPPRESKAPTKELEFVTPEGEVKKLKFPHPGKVGFQNSNWARPENYVLRNSPAGPWSRDLLIAMFAWENGRPEIAETAMHRAVAAGMTPNLFTDFYGSMIALERGDDAAAKELFKKTQSRFPKGEIPIFFLNGVKTYAFHYHDFPLLRRAVEMEAVSPYRIRPHSIDDWAKFPVDPAKSLLATARARAGEDAIPTVETKLDDWWKANWGRLHIPDVMRDGVHMMVGTPQHSTAFYFTPKEPIRDAIWEITFAIGSADQAASAASNSTTIAMMDASGKAASANNKGFDNRQIAKICFGENRAGGHWSGFGGGPRNATLYNQRQIPWMNESEVANLKRRLNAGTAAALPADKSKIIHLAIIRLGNESEININGKTYMRLPVDPKVEDVGCFIQFVGAAVSVDGMTLRPIKPE